MKEDESEKDQDSTSDWDNSEGVVGALDDMGV